MIGLILLYWIGKYYYQLAEAHGKSKWGFAMLGIVAYYVGAVVSGILLGIFIELIAPGYFDTINDFLLSLMLLPFGIACTYLLYYYFKRSWERQAPEIIIEDSDPKKQPEVGV
ncbi:hypothetical protein ACFSYG_03615 [Leeuwenhoekiella polynyae]|uniref:Uncharacterized protein n=1 Tax=Leeuwenhoekiella polynyae TaxID=1550906 RepID=A0A4Q0PHZ6_9FLAO|nr:hypothetical protein [Leeuwenhoekiella polynyae]RXG26637.1 hypothetical protein DSM02_637 [Leeuwenhoekiella polynyae]